MHDDTLRAEVATQTARLQPTTANLRAQVQAQARRLGIGPTAHAVAEEVRPIGPSASRPHMLGVLLSRAFDDRPMMVGMPIHLVMNRGVR